MNATEPRPEVELITPRARRWVWVSAALVLAVMALVILQQGRDLHQNKLAAQARHAELFTETQSDQFSTGAEAIEVRTGLYVDRIPAVSIKEVTWQADFFIWFRWRGSDLEIGDDFHNSFRVVNGWASEAQLDERVDQGDDHYVRFRVVAQISKFFDLRRYPLDDHLLTINIEHRNRPRQELRLVPDLEHSGLSSRAKITAFRISKSEICEQPHAYQTTLGDPRLTEETKAVFSQFRYGLSVERDGWGYLCKMFQGLFASIAVALVAMFIKPTDVDPRFGLGVGAFFAAIANSYITSSLMPDTGIATLADVINGLAMTMIFVTIVQSTVSLYLYDIRGREALSRYFDWVSFWVLLLGAVGFNAVMPWIAAR